MGIGRPKPNENVRLRLRKDDRGRQNSCEQPARDAVPRRKYRIRSIDAHQLSAKKHRPSAWRKVREGAAGTPRASQLPVRPRLPPRPLRGRMAESRAEACGNVRQGLPRRVAAAGRRAKLMCVRRVAPPKTFDTPQLPNLK